MSPKSDTEFWASRMQRRYRIHNLDTGEKCEVSAGYIGEAIANLRWGEDRTVYVYLGRKQQLAKPLWYKRDITIEGKDPNND